MKEDEAGFRRSFEAHLNYFRNLRKETMARTGRGMNVTEFLEARIAEDEKWARQEDADYADTTLLPTYDSDHQANWNTARVLAECAAKRAVIDAHHRQDEDDDPGAWIVASEVLLKSLAAVYKDHPDYQQEWAL